MVTMTKSYPRVSLSNRLEFKGESPMIRHLLADAEIAATGGDRPILITGAIGAGKSHLARHIHCSSPRSAGPLVFVDCGALGELDNLLFGHRVGSFTGASRNLEGRLKQAERGVLVLDDFDRLSLQQQDQLHRVVVDGVYHPVGSDRPSRVDMRLIATTNKDLSREIDAGNLREDFVSRLNYFELRVPSLHEHPEDIASLCQELLRRNLEDLVRSGVRSKADLAFHADCWPVIQARRFEDNVRGLDKLIVRLIAHARERTTIRPSDIEAVLPSVRSVRKIWFDQPKPLRIVRDSAEREYIVEVCRHTGFNLRKAARILEISPKTLYSKLAQYGITRP